MSIIEELTIESVVFELRFENAYLLWDVSGALWISLLRNHPSLKNVNAQPNQQTFENETLRFTLDVNQLKVSGKGPKALSEVTSATEVFFELVTHSLRLSVFKRAGLRIISSRKFTNSSEAMSFASNPHTPQSTNFDVSWKPVGFSNSIRLESENSGLLSSLRVEERYVDISAPWEVNGYVKGYKDSKHWVIADGDFYTKGDFHRDSFDVEGWIKQANRAIRRHWSTL